jgi:hypothetical protein
MDLLIEDLQGSPVLFWVSICWGLRVSEVWPTEYRRGHARRSFQIDGRTDLTTHTQAKKAIDSQNDLATAGTPEFLNSKAGEILSTRSPMNSKLFLYRCRTRGRVSTPYRISLSARDIYAPAHGE